MRIGSLCSGAGMLDMAVAAVTGGEVAWHCEVDADASTVLAAHHPGVPNHGDLTAVDWRQAEPVDVLAGGIPCQPWSKAGQKRKGSDDERDLWPIRKVGPDGAVARGALDAIATLRPRLVFVENVSNLLDAEESRAFGTILLDLHALGYSAAWGLVGACRVGACHHRHRLFLAATLGAVPAPRFEPLGHVDIRRAQRPWRQHAQSLFGDRSFIADWPHFGLMVGGTAWALSGQECGANGRMLPTPTARDATRGRGRKDPNGRPLSEVLTLLPADGFGPWAPAIRRHEATYGRTAPQPTEPGPRGGEMVGGRFAEWMMCLPDGHVSDHVGREATVRIGGLGVVPAAAMLAYDLLLSRLGALAVAA